MEYCISKNKINKPVRVLTKADDVVINNQTEVPDVRENKHIEVVKVTLLKLMCAVNKPVKVVFPHERTNRRANRMRAVLVTNRLHLVPTSALETNM